MSPQFYHLNLNQDGADLVSQLVRLDRLPKESPPHPDPNPDCRLDY